jgi:hypothetical protein
MSDSKVVDLLGYKYAKSGMKQDERTFDALKYLFAKQMQKKTTVIEWTSVNDRLPEGEIRLFAIVVQCIGNLKPYLSSSNFIHGEWTHCNSAETVTYWAELPEELP